MTEKVRITQAQADAIERMIKVHSDIKEIEEIHKILIREKLEVGWRDVDFRNANDIPDIDFIDALRIGYDIEPDYKVGNWIVVTGEHHGSCGEVLQVKRIGKSSALGQRCAITCTDGYDDCVRYLSEIRHATPEEITVEKERRKWAGIGREVNQFIDGDVVVRSAADGVKGSVYKVKTELKYIDDCTAEDAQHMYEKGKMIGFFPAASFISFEDGDTNA